MMQAIAVAAAILALALGALALASAPETVAASHWAEGLAVLALATAVVGLALAWVAMRRLARLAAQIGRLGKGVDDALRQIAQKDAEREAAIEAMHETIRRAVLPAAAEAQAAGWPAFDDKVLPHPALRRETELPVQPAVSAGMLEEAIRGSALDISLQPVIAVPEGHTAGFDVHAHLSASDGTEVDVWRLSRETGQDIRAGFEAAIIRKALETGRRRLDADRGQRLFCPVSSALLDRPQLSQEIARLLALYPSGAHGLTLCLEGAELAGLTGDSRDALEAIVAGGTPVAVEDWPLDPGLLAATRAYNADVLRLSSGRLLGRDRQRRGTASAADLAAAGAALGMTVLAVGVENDEDALNLVDLGVKMMVGPRFSPPRRLREDALPERPQAPAVHG